METRVERSPQEKVAVLLQLLGEETAAKVLRRLSVPEVQKVALAIMKMPPPDLEEAKRIAQEFLEEFQKGGAILAQGEHFVESLIHKALDREAASRVLETLHSPEGLDAFESLNRSDPQVVAEFIKTEHPQTIAVILAHMDPQVGGKVLSRLPEAVRVEVVHRMARLKDVSPQVMREVSEILQAEVLNLSDVGREVGGLKTVAEILNHTDKAVEAEIMERLQKEDHELAEGIQQLMFVFEDLIRLDDLAIQSILREVDTKLLAKALRGANEEIREKIYNNMSKRAAEVLQEEMEAMGPTRLSEVEEAQMEIIKVALRLQEEGKIVIGGSEEDDVFI
jgi:flagellar motor switch protein FliG